MAISKANSRLKMALASVAAVGFMSGSAMAEDAPKTQFSTASSTNASATLSQAQIDRLSADGAAADYAATGYGKIGVSVLHGSDFPQMSAEQIANGFSNGIQRNFNLPSEGYTADNGLKATEVTFHYLIPPSNQFEEPSLLSSGPHNVDEALVEVQSVGKSVQTIAQKQNVLLVEEASYEN